MNIEQYIKNFKYDADLVANFETHLNKDANTILKAVYGEEYDNYCAELMQNLRTFLENFFEEGSNSLENKPEFTAANFIELSNSLAVVAKANNEKVAFNGNKDWATVNNAFKAVKVLLVQLLVLPDSASSYFNLGDRLNNLMADDGESAIIIFELSTIKYPDRNWPFYKLGKLLIKISNNKDKLKKLQQIFISSEAGGIGDKKQASGYANIQTVQKQIDDNLKEDKIPLPFLTDINNKDEYTPEFKDTVNNYLSKTSINDISSDIKETKAAALFTAAALSEFLDNLGNDKNDIIKDAFGLVYLVSLFRAKQFVPKDSTTYYQYTAENTLKSIMALDEPNNLQEPQIKVRLYNILGMNDPFEGKYSYSLLDYNPIESNIFMPSDTYIASFIREKKESLAMWKMYGDDFKGVRLGFEFTQNTSDIPDSDKEIFPELYQVAYFDEATILEVTKACPKSATLHEIGASNESKNEVIFAEIKKVVSNLTETIASTEKTIADKLTVLIDQQLEKIRYLIKDSIYKSEYEYRLLVRIDSAIIKDEAAGAKAAKEVNDTQEHSEKPVLHFDKGNPKLYYEFEDVELASIIFGTSFDKAYQWIPFLSIKVPELMATNQITSSELEGRYR